MAASPERGGVVEGTVLGCTGRLQQTYSYAVLNTTRRLFRGWSLSTRSGRDSIRRSSHQGAPC